MSVTDH